MRLLVVVWAACLAAVPALADWNPGEPHKMHFPQLPDPMGWDVNDTCPKVLADDWLCTGTGPVTDVHFWGSWEYDQIGELCSVELSIHANDLSGPFSRPGDLLWSACFVPPQFTVRPYGTGDQGWYDPNTGVWRRPDHFQYFQVNIEDIPNPFVQVEGNIYWLDVSVFTQGGVWGWKTSYAHFMDDAVWGDFPAPIWEPLVDPITGRTIDLAFVITPEPGALAILGLSALALLRRR